MKIEMSSRLTETEKWRDPWFSELSLNAKILFLFLCDQCDIAGFYERYDKMTSAYTGLTTEEISEAYAELSKSVFIRGRWVFVKNFIKHQKNTPLNPLNRYHQSIIKILKSKKDLFSDVYEEFHKALASPLQGASKALARACSLSSSNSLSNNKKPLATKFPEFWIMYPRKVNKPGAFKSWLKTNADNDESLRNRIMMALANHRKSDQWQKDDGQFIPHPTTWLNQRRWEDDIRTANRRPRTGWDRILGRKNEEHPVRLGGLPDL